MEVSNDITLKELFERIIVVETKLDGISERNNRVEKRFVHYVLLLGGLVIIDLLFTLLLVIEQIEWLKIV